jgi:hypothetical protein
MTVVDMRTSSKGAIAQAIRPGVQLNQADITFAIAALADLSNVAGLTNFTLRYVNTTPAQLTSGQVGENGAYVVDSKSGWLAYLGGSNDPNPLHNRLIELQQILALAQQQQLKLATIDLRFGLRPVYTLKS